jgi:asparagine synthase (glutamine-hydrolysing)
LLRATNESLVTLSSLPEPGAQGEVTDEEEFIELFRDYPGVQINHVRAPGLGPFDDAEELVKTGALNAYGFQHYMYSALVRAGREKGIRLLLDGYGGELSASAHIRGFLPELLMRGRFSRLLSELKTTSGDGRIHASSLKRQVVRPLIPFRLLKAAGRHERFDNLAAYPVREELVRDVLGEEVNQVRDQLLELLVKAPNHRTNMAQSIRHAQQDLRLRSHAGFRGYEQVRFSYPLLDKRLLEFGLAVDGRFKLENGEDRRLIRMASKGLVPDEIQKRSSKAAFCPDYHLRYLRQRDDASQSLHELSRDRGLSKIVDFEKVFSALNNRPAHDPKKPMAVDYDSQFLVPYAWFMCYFLRNFKG